jgi:hypothetical protein
MLDVGCLMMNSKLCFYSRTTFQSKINNQKSIIKNHLAPIPPTSPSLFPKQIRHFKLQKSFPWLLFPACGCVLLLTKLYAFVGAWEI